MKSPSKSKQEPRGLRRKGKFNGRDLGSSHHRVFRVRSVRGSFRLIVKGNDGRYPWGRGVEQSRVEASPHGQSFANGATVFTNSGRMPAGLFLQATLLQP
jgi:hypothetical protein